MIDSRDSEKILDVLLKKLGVAKIGAYTYDGRKLLCCGSSDSGDKFINVVELHRFERLWKNGMHEVDWYEMSLFKLNVIANVPIQFKLYCFISLDDIAWHLKMHLADVEAAVARTLLKQAFSGGVCVANLTTFKLRSLEEILIYADLL